MKFVNSLSQMFLISKCLLLYQKNIIIKSFFFIIIKYTITRTIHHYNHNLPINIKNSKKYYLVTLTNDKQSIEHKLMRHKIQDSILRKYVSRQIFHYRKVHKWQL
jgi:uncharacterized protein YbcV (DUF1398 family)